MSKKKNDTSFLVQGSILAIASLVSRVIGLVYRIPLTAIIGDHGNDYYSCAYEIYSLLLLISSYSLPMAVSKMVSARISNGEKQNAYRVFKGAMIFALFTGTVACMIVFFGAEELTRLFKTPLGVYALQVLAPTLIIVAVLGVFRGFFQGMGTMIPSAVSQIIEQIVNAVVSVGAAYVLFAYGRRIATVLGSKEHYDAAYGAAGGTLGTSAGALCGLAFIIFVFSMFLPKFRKAMRRENKIGKKQPESYRVIFGILIGTIVPVLMSTTIYNMVSIVDQWLFKNIATIQGYSATDVSEWWGIFSGKYRVLTNVPISISTALAASCVPALAAAFAQKDEEQVRSKISMSMRFIMVVAMPCTAGIMVLADPIIQLLFPGSSPLAGHLLQAGGISVIFYSISTLSNAVLQGIDRMRIPVRNASVALVLHAGVIAVGMFGLKLNIYGICVGTIAFSLIMCILNGMSVRKYSGFKPDVTKTFIKPAIASAIMGVVVYAAYFVCHKISHSNAVSTVIAVLVGMIVYAAALLLIKGLTEEELHSFPKGELLIRIAKKFRLL
jgi:stage V sporulation protein B